MDLKGVCLNCIFANEITISIKHNDYFKLLCNFVLILSKRK